MLMVRYRISGAKTCLNGESTVRYRILVANISTVKTMVYLGGKDLSMVRICAMVAKQFFGGMCVMVNGECLNGDTCDDMVANVNIRTGDAHHMVVKINKSTSKVCAVMANISTVIHGGRD